jgi:uncharacterized protein YndB with AHSA1/START domain
MSKEDRIERHVVVKASRSRVWRALTDYKEFGTWFRVKLEGPFVLGQKVSGQMTYPGYEHMKFEATVDRMDTDQVFSFRWPPAENRDDVPMTTVEFTLEDVEGGTKITVVESGFEKLPADLRDKVFRDNQGGWTEQMKNIEAHVDG